MRTASVWLVLVATLVVAVGGTAAAIVVSTSNEDERVDYAVSQCRSGNLRTAYELANHSDGQARSQLALDVFTINDCPATVMRGSAVPVSLEVQAAYVRMVVRQRVLPLITDGQITGAGPLPSQQR